MSEFVWPAVYAIVLWWASTVAIIYLDGLPRKTFRWSMLGATAVCLAAFYGLAVSSADTNPTGVYLAFTSGLLAWGWQEISFYMGYVTGPRKQPCPEGCSGFRHFIHAVEVSLYHELAIVAAAAVVFAVTWHKPNQVGVWTFMVLWWMHQSAKLNVFFGVRNLNEEYIPDHLDFLKRFLTKKPMNPLFPVCVSASTLITGWLAQRALVPGASPFMAIGNTFLATLMALAVLEHWLLVLPLPSRILWGWGLRSRGSIAPFEVDIAVGFLGAGKTTFLRRLLADADRSVRTVALVNDFSELGVDASLLRGGVADVVELANGCICCSLRKDLAVQLKEVMARWAPERVLIEPSGVADVASLLGVLHQRDLAAIVRSLRVYTVIDAGAFLQDFARLPEYFEAQARLAPVFIISKTDLASPEEVETVRDTLRSLNPRAPIVAANYGHLPENVLDGLSMAPLYLPAAEDASHRHEPRPAHRHDHHGAGAHGHAHDHAAQGAGHDPTAALGLKSWTMRVSGPCDLRGLRDVLEAVARGAYGEVDRLKGIVRTGAGWVHFDVAGGRSSIAAFAPRAEEIPRVIAIGRSIHAASLEAAIEGVLADRPTGGAPLRAAEAVAAAAP